MVKLHRRAFLISASCAALFIGRADARFPHGAITNFPLQPLSIGAGGQVNGVDIAPDGTTIIWTDTFGAYILDKIASKWRQLCTTSQLPIAAWSTPLSGTGVPVARVCRSNSQIIYMVYGQLPAQWVFVSTDQGNTWARCGSSFTQTMLPNGNRGRFQGPKMDIDSNNPDLVYLATDTAGIWFTLNGRLGLSATWTQISTATIPANLSSGPGCIVIDGTSGTTGGKSNKAYISSAGNGLYATHDAGITWALVSGTAGFNIARLKMAADGTIYVAVDAQDKLYKVTWSGSTPVLTDVTPPTMGANGNIVGVVCDPNVAAHVTAFGFDNFNGQFQDSVNAGGAWSTANNTAYTLDTTQIPWHSNLFALNSGGLAMLDIAPDPSTNPVNLVAVGLQSMVQTSYPMQSVGTAQHWVDIGNGIEQIVGLCVCVPPGHNPLVGGEDVGLLQSVGPNTNAPVHQWDTTRFLNACHYLDYASSNSNIVIGVFNGFPNNAPPTSGVSSDGGFSWTPWAGQPLNYQDVSVAGQLPGTDFALNGGCAAASATNWIYQPASGWPVFTLSAGALWAPSTANISAVTYNSATGILSLTSTAAITLGKVGNLVQLAGLSDPGYTISSGTYNSTTGLVTLTLSASATFSAGVNFTVAGLTGTGTNLGNLDGTFVAASVSGTTVTYTAATGLGSITITGGSANLNVNLNGNFVVASVSGTAITCTIAKNLGTLTITPSSATLKGSDWSPTATPSGNWNGSPFFTCNNVAADRVNFNSGGTGIGTFYMYNSIDGKMYVSTDGGATWAFFLISLTGSSIGLGTLKAVPSQAGHMFRNSWGGSGGSFSPSGFPFYRLIYTGSGVTVQTTGLDSVFGHGFGSPAPGKSYPSILAYGYKSGVLGVWRSIDTTPAAIGTWQQLINSFPDGGMYPDGWPDLVTDITGDMSNYGSIYWVKSGSGYGVGRVA